MNEQELYMHRVCVLTRTLERAQDPEFKDLWQRKIDELIAKRHKELH